MFDAVLKKLVGSKNDRELKRIRPIVARVNDLEPAMAKLSHAELQAKVRDLKEQIAKGRSLDDVHPEAFALTREAGKRALGMRHFDVQLIGGSVLHQGKIAEMRTGEGKTLVATLPAVLNALEGRGVHVVTVNDYLAKRDAEWMGRLYGYLGLTTGVVVHGLTDEQRQAAYRCDITYGQNNEFGFDYLRDNMKFSLSKYVQREANFAIVDEVDSILIDEARTPLIIAGPSDDTTDLYGRVNDTIPRLVRDRDYVVDEKHRSVTMTDDGIERVEKMLGIGNLYDPASIEMLHHVEQALRAHTLYKKDVNYVIQQGEVVIVDEHTGRLMPGRRWSDGLHQAVESKEGVEVQAETQTYATVSFQNYFRMYSKLSGMTGTADTEAEEFAKIYNLDVVVVPTNRAMQRVDNDDVVFKTEREKFHAVADDIEEAHKKGQPVLVGTVTIAKSEALSHILKKRGIPHSVLNAKQHENEAKIVAQAGRKGAVTIATNMAGRGTDILLGGNPEFLAKAEVGAHPPERATTKDADGKDVPESDESLAARVAQYEKDLAAAIEKYKAQVDAERKEVLDAGGLHIVGTERHESRRIDNQLRGRAGRQGDPGSSRFYLSLEDDLMRIFAADTIKGLMDWMGVEDNEPITHPMLSRSIAGAQQRVEGQNFDMRKNLLEYDDVMNQQRKTIYSLRRRVLAAGHDQPLVEFDEDPITRKKVRKEAKVTWNDLRERVLDAIEDAVLQVLDEAVPQKKDEFDPARLQRLVKEQFGIDMTFKQGDAVAREGLENDIFTVAEKAYLAKEKVIGETWRNIEQSYFLQVIDSLWKDHLLTMDHLRQGIGLRGYGQKDPKQEYKKEGFELFRVMLSRISSSVVHTLMVRLQPAQPSAAADAQADAALQQQLMQRALDEARRKKEAELRRAQETRNEGDLGPQTDRAPQKPQPVKAAPKVGRNDPCPCGSGKKYKKCHGAGLPDSDGAST